MKVVAIWVEIRTGRMCKIYFRILLRKNERNIKESIQINRTMLKFQRDGGTNMRETVSILKRNTKPSIKKLLQQS